MATHSDTSLKLQYDSSIMEGHIQLTLDIGNIILKLNEIANY